MGDTNDLIWDKIVSMEGRAFRTIKGKEFTYHLRRTKHGESRGEIEIDHSMITISRATAILACHQAQEVQEKKGFVKGPGKLGTHGAQYLYPIFIDMGICSNEPGAELNVFKEPVAVDNNMTADRMADTEGLLPGTAVMPGSLVKQCKGCGYTTEEDFDFCPKCGMKF